MHRPAGCDTPATGRVTEGDARGEQPAVVGGYAEDLEYGSDLEVKHRRQRGPDSFGSRREHGGPRSWEDRSAARVVLHEAEQQHRVLLEVVGEMLRTALNAEHLLALGIVGRCGRRRDAVLVDGFPQHAEAPAVDGPERVAYLGVVDHE